MAYRIDSLVGTSTDDGLHDCARGQVCAGRKTVLDDGRLVVVPAQTYTAYCMADRSRIFNCLDDLPRRYGELGGRIGDKTQHGGVRVSGGGSTPSVPLNLGVQAFQAYLVEVLVSWEERIRYRVPLSDISGARRDKQAFAVACAILAGHLDALLALKPDSMYRTLDISRYDRLPVGASGVVHPNAGWIGYNHDYDGIHAGGEVLDLHYRSLAMLGWTPQHHDLLSPCWDCEVPRLRRWDGTAGLADHVVCRNCASEYLADRLARLMVEEENTIRRRNARRSAQPEALEAAS